VGGNRETPPVNISSTAKTIFHFLRSHFSSLLFLAMNSLQDLSEILLQFLLPCCFKESEKLKKFLGWEKFTEIEI
jgi:hypothetical protein